MIHIYFDGLRLLGYNLYYGFIFLFLLIFPIIISVQILKNRNRLHSITGIVQIMITTLAVIFLYSCILYMAVTEGIIEWALMIIFAEIGFVYVISPIILATILAFVLKHYNIEHKLSLCSGFVIVESFLLFHILFIGPYKIFY